jgi:hypothetical protein
MTFYTPRHDDLCSAALIKYGMHGRSFSFRFTGSYQVRRAGYLYDMAVQYIQISVPGTSHATMPVPVAKYPEVKLFQFSGCFVKAITCFATGSFPKFFL